MWVQSEANEEGLVSQCIKKLCSHTLWPKCAIILRFEEQHKCWTCWPTPELSVDPGHSQMPRQVLWWEARTALRVAAEARVTCCQECHTYVLAWCRVATDLKFIKNIISAKLTEAKDTGGSTSALAQWWASIFQASVMSLAGIYHFPNVKFSFQCIIHPNTWNEEKFYIHTQPHVSE